MTQTPDRAYMTPLLNRIADVAGERAALILGREKAGQQIYIPGTVTPEHWLSQLVGYDAAVAIVGAFGIQNIVIPAALAGEKIRRARVIAELLDNGYSINEIVRRTGVSFSTVRNHSKKRGKKNDQQGELF
ncbi:helix-turn-helix domain-containing protein [Agrobacterium sp. SORGH_AS 787]|uniref:winged helix-turn-helix domain-containing protein n=1 Tax=Agrobacterium sp. SORGH_AS 787 TaxID=3041775 RepID=UPI00277E21C1|nr:DNA-binding NarL/FixJ family response regulator [Rhizobium sp. SORGH_AS_0787]